MKVSSCWSAGFSRKHSQPTPAYTSLMVGRKERKAVADQVREAHYYHIVTYPLSSLFLPPLPPSPRHVPKLVPRGIDALHQRQPKVPHQARFDERRYVCVWMNVSISMHACDCLSAPPLLPPFLLPSPYLGYLPMKPPLAASTWMGTSHPVSAFSASSMS